MKIILLLTLVFATACSGRMVSISDGEKRIQGKWRASGEIGENEGNKHSWLMEWEFEAGEFTQNGNPPLRQTGQYEIVETSEKRIILRLYRQKGTFGEKDSNLVIILEADKNSLTIGGRKGFSRVTPGK